MRYSIIIILLTLFGGACSTDELDTYNAERYLFFHEKYADDSISTSFFFYPGENTLSCPIELAFAGKPIEEDLDYEIDIDPETTASPSDYTFETKRVWKAFGNRDTLKVVLNKTDDLENRTVRLVLRVKANGNFQVGPTTNQIYRIIFTSMAAKPSWWDQKVTDEYLGTYSAAKYHELIVATGVSDLEGKNAQELRYYSLKLKYHLQKLKDEGTPVMDGSQEMSVPVKG